jgi:GcrA cell cycle regulator
LSWTDDRINTLKKMWQSGKSASEIAEKLGGVTRNAVIGKAHRLGLSGRPSPIKKVVKKSMAPAPVKKAVPAPRAAPAPKASMPATKQPAIAPKIAPAKIPVNSPGKPAEFVPLAAMANMTSRKDGAVVSILELSERICRWPVGDPKEPGFGYCGSEVLIGHPYCGEHVAIAFQAPNRKDGKKPVTALKAAEPALEDLEVEVEDDEEAEDDTLADDLEDDDAAAVVVPVKV